jgi:hypothetical protein
MRQNLTWKIQLFCYVAILCRFYDQRHKYHGWSQTSVFSMSAPVTSISGVIRVTPNHTMVGGFFSRSLNGRSGATTSRQLVSDEFRLRAISSRHCPVLHRSSRADSILVHSCLWSTFLIILLLTHINFGDCTGRARVNTTGWWSEIRGQILLWSSMASSLWVMPRSNVCPFEWVGSWISWWRLNVLSKSWNWWKPEADGVSTQMLKSPRSKTCDGEVTTPSKNLANSATESELMGQEDGRYTLWICRAEWDLLFERAIVADINSNDEGLK